MIGNTPGPELKEIGSYELLGRIAEGGMGEVYKGRSRKTGDLVAIKVVPPFLAKHDVVLQRFQQEYRIASSLDHPNVVRAVDFGRDGDSYFLVMEFVEGESLGDRIERLGRLPEADAVSLIVQISEGLNQAHQKGMIHRDVKPDNIIIDSSGVAKLVDLGLAKEMDSSGSLTRTGRGLGTPHFMSPEQFRDAKRVGLRSDIYSLGATLYMAVTGELPFRSLSPLDAWMKKVRNELPKPRDIVPGLSERVDWAIRRAMSADPNRRPASCQEFIQDLVGKTNGAPDAKGWWYFYYSDPHGETKTLKGTAEAIRKALKQGKLGDANKVRAAVTKKSSFEPLQHYPEFRDLVISPAELKVDRTTLEPVLTESGESIVQTDIALATRPLTATSSRLPQIMVADGRPKNQTSLATWVMFLFLALAAAFAGFYFMTRW